MKEKRIASYMSVNTVCAVLCCAAAAYLLLEIAVDGGSLYEDLLRPAISLLAAFVLFRHFVVRYRLRLRSKPLWVKLTAAILYSAFLAAVLTAFSALCVFMIVNRALWDDPVPYAVFLRKELTAWPLRSFNWNAPAVLLAVEGLYVFVCESKLGQRDIRPVLSLFFTSPFPEQDFDPWDCDTEEGGTAAGKKTTILPFTRNGAAQSESAGTDDGEKK